MRRKASQSNPRPTSLKTRQSVARSFHLTSEVARETVWSPRVRAAYRASPRATLIRRPRAYRARPSRTKRPYPTGVSVARLTSRAPQTSTRKSVARRSAKAKNYRSSRFPRQIVRPCRRASSVGRCSCHRASSRRTPSRCTVKASRPRTLTRSQACRSVRTLIASSKCG